MARDRLDVAKKQHRERGQLKHRQRLGLLEKHADYVKRAKDFHSKEDRIKKLRQKASTRNKDEFYFGMVRGRTQKGVHIQDRGNESMPIDVVKLLKTQDAGYVRTLLSTEENIIGRLKNELACTVAFQSDDHSDVASEYNDSEDEENDKGEGTSKQRILHLLGSGDARPKKTVFVDTANEVTKWKPKAQVQIKAAAYKGKGKAKQQSAQAIAAAERSAAKASEERKARLFSLTEELEARNERLALLQRTFREMQVQRAVMGKGSKNVVGTKTKGLSREDARLNQDDLDELELKRALNQKVKLPEPGIGVATGARVWKWKAERRR